MVHKINLLCCELDLLFTVNNFFADIETYNADKQLNKVMVTGDVTTEEVIRVLHKIGKNATPWEDAQP